MPSLFEAVEAEFSAQIEAATLALVKRVSRALQPQIDAAIAQAMEMGVGVVKIPPQKGATTPATSAPKRGRGRPRKAEGADVQIHVKVAASTVVSLIVDHMKANPGASGQSARRVLGVPTAPLNLAIRTAVAEGHLRKEGEGRGSRYWAT